MVDKEDGMEEDTALEERWEEWQSGGDSERDNALSLILGHYCI